MRPVSRRLALAIAATVAVALASPARAGGFRCSERGGHAWREVRTAHFAVVTDLSSSRAQQLARELERLHEVVRYGLFRAPPDAPGRLRVVAFAEDDDFALFAPKGAAAFYLPDTSAGPSIVMPGGLRDAQRIVIAHEITHHLTARIFARQPRWFSEGIATVMESAGSNGPDDLPTIGGVARHRHREVYPYHGGVAKVLAAKDGLEDSRQYAVAWALVHYLLNEHGRELGQLQQRFARGEDPASAWREVFPQWDPAKPGATDALDDAIGRYLGHGSFGYRDVKLPPEQPVTERALPAAEAHAVRLSLPRWSRGGSSDDAARLKADLKAELDETLGHDQGSVAALALLAAAASPEEAQALAARATTAHPEDARAWLLLARSTPDARRREAALRKTIEVEPSAEALNELAWLLLVGGRSGEALPLARSAAGLAPWNAAALDTYSAVLEDLGQCAPARSLQQRAVDLLPEGAASKARAPYLERLARLDHACGGAASAPPRPAPAEGTPAGAPESSRTEQAPDVPAR